MPHVLTYVLITPARNEARFIELTLESVIAQTVHPLKWVIVSDGSTDGTDEIVQRYAAERPWIELVRMPERRERHFGGKVIAFNAGWERVKHLRYEIIGSLDADISFGPDYFEFLLEKFAANPDLGVGGTPFKEGSGTYDFRFTNIEHVSGACQMFRRECFEQIGGYRPIKGGGIDYFAVVSARMQGWKTRTFTDKVCIHHREIGTAQHGALTARFKYGRKDYVFANHPVWEVSRTFYQMTRRPLIIGGTAMLAGYTWAALRRAERSVTREMAEFIQREQMQRLKKFLLRSKITGPSAVRESKYS